jgi:DNA-binding CsgD family transcriptional regulator
MRDKTMRPRRTAESCQTHGLIVLRDAGHWSQANPGALALIERYFPASRSRCVVPMPLRLWIASRESSARPGRDWISEPFWKDRRDRRLCVRLIATDARRLLLLEEEMVSSGAIDRSDELLLALGLTAREAEILMWIREGKSNSAIGSILGIASATVKKHLEHVFAKLGVENRTCAAARASDALQHHHGRPSKVHRFRRRDPKHRTENEG